MVAFLRLRKSNLRGGPRADSVILYVAANGALTLVASDGTETVVGGGGSFTPAGFVEPTTATPEELANSLIAAQIMSGVPGAGPTPLPTADPHTVGAFWNNNGVVMVSAG